MAPRQKAVKRQPVSYRLDPDTIRRLDAIAARKGSNHTQVIRDLVQKAIGRCSAFEAGRRCTQEADGSVYYFCKEHSDGAAKKGSK